jgi:SAM-dependent methyltransferase
MESDTNTNSEQVSEPVKGNEFEDFAIIDGFKCYSPEMAHSGGGFKAEYFHNLVKCEDYSFWFRARNKLITWAIGKYKKSFKNMLEIGCGTGFVLREVSRCFPESKISGSEIFVDGLKYAQSRTESAEFFQLDARKMPFDNEYDVVGAFDVLEHIEEDELTIANINKALKPGGMFIATVPQHRWLWSASDDYAHHYRRYSANELQQKLKDSNFEIIRTTSFVSFLLPAMYLSRINSRDVEEFNSENEFNISTPVNWMLYQIMKLETFLIRLGVNFPIGGSRLVVAKKI